MQDKIYKVKVPVWSTIEVEVIAESEEHAEEVALFKAIEDHPKVDWEVDQERDFEVTQ